MKEKTEQSFVLELFEGMRKDNLSYIYRGDFCQSITDAILSLTEANMEKAGESSKIKKRVFTIMVEGLQNITRHQEIDEKVNTNNEKSIFFLQEIDDRYYITTGNPILKSNIKLLTEQLNTINSLDKDKLKEYYKTVLKDNIISDKGGAGLGLIEMARKSGNKLVFDFIDLSDNYSYFYLNTEIAQLNLDPNSKKSVVSSLENIKELHRILNQEEVVLIFNGLFNQDSLLNLLSIMEGQMEDSNLSLKKKVFNIMVEMLQNIVKHASRTINEKDNPGIFFINQSENKYVLNSGNYILKTEVDNLKSKIDYINSLSLDELNKFYEKSLFNFQVDTSKESGLGLIELRLKTGRKLNYNIADFNDIFSFFALKIVIDQ